MLSDGTEHLFRYDGEAVREALCAGLHGAIDGGEHGGAPDGLEGAGSDVLREAMEGMGCGERELPAGGGARVPLRPSGVLAVRCTPTGSLLQSEA